MCFHLDKKQLTSLGFRKVALDAFTATHHRFNIPEEQWEYNNVILTANEKDGKFHYRFFDKATPGFTLGFQNYHQLKQILYLIDQGKKITDILLLEQESRQKHVEDMLELQKKKPYLEDYRYNDIGGSFFEISSATAQKVYMTYEKHATSAYYYTLNDVANLEHSNDIVHTGSQSYSAISLWFLTFESYINSLVKLCCIKKNKSFEIYKRQDLHTKVGSLGTLVRIRHKELL